MTSPYLDRLCILTLSLGVSAIAAGHARTSPATEIAQAVQHDAGQSPLCDPDLIDGTFTFANLPAGEQTISLHFENKSNAACRLYGQAQHSFAVDGHDMIVASCRLCGPDDTESRYPEQRPGNQIILAPGGRATLDFHWTSTGGGCQWADWVDFIFVQWAKKTAYLFIPSEWPLHICSAVKSAGYHAEADSPSIGEARVGVLHVSVREPTIYSDEHATLHAEITGATASVANPSGCASLYTVRQEPSVPVRTTRFEPINTMGYLSRPSYTPEQIMEDKERAWPSWRKDRLRKCEIEGGRITADADISAANLANVTHVEWRTAPASGEDSVILTATTHFTVLDVDTLAPNWGDPVAGIQAGLSVDRTRVSLGERIPLHVRWENVNADMPLAQGECGGPEPVLEIQDSEHKVLQTTPIEQMCFTHGWGPSKIEKGRALRSFIELTTSPPTPPRFLTDVAGELPGPGVYYLVSVWSPRVLDPPDANTVRTPRSSGRFGGVYATARSLPVRVGVAPGNNP